MPELPEVETMVRGIRHDCTDRVIDHLEFVRTRRRPISVSPSRPALVRAAGGRTVIGISRLAKRIIMTLDSGDSIVVEPRMTGLLLIADPPTMEHRRVVWHFRPKGKRSDTLEFWDRRGLGTISLLSPTELAELQARLGPDALNITLNDLTQRLKATSREIKVALLDQHLIGGIGNLYASEILHEARILPRRSAASLTKPQVIRILKATHRILNEAIVCEGSTLGDGTYRNALNGDGSYQNHHCVYQKAGEPCPACGKAKVRRIVQAQRATFYCSKCQK